MTASRNATGSTSFFSILSFAVILVFVTFSISSFAAFINEQ